MKQQFFTAILVFSMTSISYAATKQSHDAKEQPTQEVPISKIETKNDPVSHWWVNVGVGGAGGHDVGGPTSYVSGNYQFAEHQLITARYLKTDQFFDDNSNFKDIGLLYGLIAKGKYGYISGAAGLGYVRYEKDERGGLFSGMFDSMFGPLPKSSYVHYTKHTVGIPLEVQLFFTPFKYVGIGLIGFGNINSAQTVRGAALALQFGLLN